MVSTLLHLKPAFTTNTLSLYRFILLWDIQFKLKNTGYRVPKGSQQAISWVRSNGVLQWPLSVALTSQSALSHLLGTLVLEGPQGISCNLLEMTGQQATPIWHQQVTKTVRGTPHLSFLVLPRCWGRNHGPTPTPRIPETSTTGSGRAGLWDRMACRTIQRISSF